MRTLLAAGGVQGNGSAGSPDEIGGVGGDYEDRFVFHGGLHECLFYGELGERGKDESELRSD